MKTISVAPSLNQIQPSRIRELANVAFTMEGVYKLQFGESNMPTPRYIKEAATKAIHDGWTFYSENAGLPALRESIARKYADLHHVALDPMREIVVTASGVQALNLTIRCTVDPGDEALVLEPMYVTYEATIQASGATLVRVPQRAENNFRVNLADLERAVTPRTRDRPSTGRRTPSPMGVSYRVPSPFKRPVCDGSSSNISL